MKFKNYYFLAIVATCFGGVHCQAGAQPSGTENDSNNNVVKECVNKTIAITYQLYTPPVSKNDIIKGCTNKPTATTYKLYTPTISKYEVIKGCTNKLTVTTYRLYTPTNTKKEAVKECINKPTVIIYKIYTSTETKEEVVKECTNKPTVTICELYTTNENQGTKSADNNVPNIFSSHEDETAQENVLPSEESSASANVGSSGEGQVFNDQGTDLTWLCILLGIIAGVISLGRIVFFVVKK
ncbi:hypothetical protein DSO57_1030742 [Entomophthora muscae]|uniref:Uncharacterized protein n=1 Tax=Entomophthora muscae TaxID=34485 RepID=A0ACC2RRU4_9FUNG|nr:hypothetical protein DSO57_1030742 [Entomophthora muscae]